MQKIISTLNRLRVSKEQLSAGLQQKINKYGQDNDKLNDEIDAYNESEGDVDDARNAAFDQRNQQLDHTEDEIVAEVNAWYENAVKSNPPVNQNQNPPVVANAGDDDGDEWGWVIFAGVALVVTFGAVNMFKNR